MTSIYDSLGFLDKALKTDFESLKPWHFSWKSARTRKACRHFCHATSFSSVIATETPNKIELAMRNESCQTHSMSQALSSTRRADRNFFKSHLNNLRRYQSERWFQVSPTQGDQRAHNTRNFYYCFRRFSVTSSVFRCHGCGRPKSSV
jgi:hypothetical protein